MPSSAEKIQIGSCPSCGTMVQVVSKDGIRAEYRPTNDAHKIKADLEAASRFITRFIIHDGEVRSYSVLALQLKLEQAEDALQEAYENADFDEPLTFEEYRADLQAQATARAQYEAESTEVDDG